MIKNFKKIVDTMKPASKKLKIFDKKDYKNNNKIKYKVEIKSFSFKLNLV